MEQLIGNISYVNAHLTPAEDVMVQNFQLGVIISYINRVLFTSDCLKYLKVPKTAQRFCSG